MMDYNISIKGSRGLTRYAKPEAEALARALQARGIAARVVPCVDSDDPETEVRVRRVMAGAAAYDWRLRRG